MNRAIEEKISKPNHSKYSMLSSTNFNAWTVIDICTEITRMGEEMKIEQEKLIGETVDAVAGRNKSVCQENITNGLL